MVHVSVQVVSSYVTPWLSNTCLISVIYFVITLYFERRQLHTSNSPTCELELFWACNDHN
jgi:hypothetical protein